MSAASDPSTPQGNAGSTLGTPPPCWSRRGFLASALAVPGAIWSATAPVVNRATRTQDPRLTARPGRPFRAVSPGRTAIGEHLDRGAYLYVPESLDRTSPAPLIVALHGGGGDTARWSVLHEHCDRHGVVLLAPEARARTWDRVRGDFGPDVAFIDAALRFVFERLAIDPGRLALAGFSDGASYALSLGPSNGDLFSHLIAWSPGFSDPTDPITGRPAVLLSHGTNDTVLSVRISRSAIVPTFELDGYDITYIEFEGGHELTAPIIQSSFDWFLGSL